jgi:uncharacterized protein (TIGR03437 family)
MDRAGSTIVFAAGDTIRLADAAGGGSSLLIGDGFAPSLSDDGRTLVYLANRAKPQLHVYRFGGADRQLGFDPAGIARAIVSGDGATIYAVTLGGRLLKVSTGTGAAQELIPRTPYLTGAKSALAPGKLTTLTGVGLTDLSFTADAPLPDTLNGIRVTIEGERTLLQSVTPNALTVLVPPTVQPSFGSNMGAVDVSLTSPSPFAGPFLAAGVILYAPEFFIVPGDTVLVAAHQDWRGVVTAADPAAPGEVIHAYAAGLGDTTPHVDYGQPAPSSEPLARITIPISCANGTDTSRAFEILYEGMAPGFAGVYQIDLRLPLDATGTALGLFCVWGGIGSGGPVLSGSVPLPGQ